MTIVVAPCFLAMSQASIRSRVRPELEMITAQSPQDPFVRTTLAEILVARKRLIQRILCDTLGNQG
jgi:hypothetical protein